MVCDHNSHHEKHTITTQDFEKEDCPCCTRRRTFLKVGLLATAGILLPTEWAKAASIRERMLVMHNPHTGENLRTVFWTPDYGYIQPSIDEISSFFRDFRQNTIKPVDIDLLNILNYMQMNTGMNRPIQLNSGFRSSKTNSMLRRHSKAVAKSSYHMEAMAADISISGFSSNDLKLVATRLNGGGVGTYRSSDFIHVDSGPIRYWRY